MKLLSLVTAAKNDVTLEALMDSFFFSTCEIESQLTAIALFARIDSDMNQISEIFEDYLGTYMNSNEPKYQISRKSEKIKIMQEILYYKQHNSNI